MGVADSKRKSPVDMILCKVPVIATLCVGPYGSIFGDGPTCADKKVPRVLVYAVKAMIKYFSMAHKGIRGYRAMRRRWVRQRGKETRHKVDGSTGGHWVTDTGDLRVGEIVDEQSQS